MWEELDLVLAMTVNPGFGGQSLIEPVLRKVERLRETVEKRGLDVHIEVDGGVKPGNVGRFASAGADVLVSGSGVFKAEDRAAAIAALSAGKDAPKDDANTIAVAAEDARLNLLGEAAQLAELIAR